LQIHQRDIRLVRAELLDGFASIRCFPDQNHVCLHPDQAGNPLTNDRMVIDRKDPNLRYSSAHR
jgi:hypothetical protein